MQLLAETQDYIRGGTQKAEYSEAEVIEVSCPLCSGPKRTRIYTEHESIGIVQCVCGLIFTSPRIKEPEAIYWGDANRYYEESRLVFEGRATHHRDPNYLAEILNIERVKKGGRLLDVGCNMGMLLRLARQRGWDVTGLEPSPSLSKLASKWGFPVRNCFLDELQEAPFDVVAFSDVFEHITKPKAFLADAARLLKTDGVLYVKVPNARWTLFKQWGLGKIGKRPKAGIWDSYEHVVHYTETTLKAMLRSGGFEPILVTTEPPIQTPNWHEYVGHYYQYPTPWPMDWKRKAVRTACYWLSFPERALRFGHLGAMAQNIVMLARKV